MDLDDAAPPPATRRPSTAHDRPSRTPFGPRRQKHSPDMSPPSADPLESAHARPDMASADFTGLAHQQFTLPPPSLPVHADAAVQTPSTPPPSSPPTLPSSKPTTTPQKTPAATFTTPPPLTPPPNISFESTPIPWKGLPLEAAQWTFSSSELQQIVSKAIRLSARESFVRLLSLRALEVDIVHESERLEAARLEAQARWRFEVGRRTMLIQALNACAAFSTPGTPGPTGDQTSMNEGGNPIIGFVGQLASTIASCDSLLSTILEIADQQSQISIIQHQHWASALGIALRKLNKAHERQTHELRRAQGRVETLEDELEEAWREAEKMAVEFDDLEEEIAESGSERGSEAVNEAGEDRLIPADARPGLDLKHDLDETGTLGDVTDIAVVLGVTATAVASKATLVSSPSSPKPVDKSDTKSIRSVKSTRSRRSTRDGPNHVTRLASARTRSRAASNASLRLPKALRSTPALHTSPVDAPPIPALPSPTNALPVPPQPSPTDQGHSFLDMSCVTPQHVRKSILPKRHPEPTLSLPTPPHSAGLAPTQVPSIWIESDAGKSTHLNGLDRAHSLQIFSSLTPRRVRRSNLVMSLTGSDRSSDAGGSGSGSRTSAEMTAAGTASPTSNHSPVSLPTHALAHFRGPSITSSSHNAGATTGGRGGVSLRPGSAGARLTTTEIGTVSGGSTRRSLVSRASSVILRRLSQATTGNRTTASGGKTPAVTSPSKSRDGSRLSGGGRSLVERWRSGGKEGDGSGNKGGGLERELEDDGEGEVMLIGSPHTDSLEAL